MISFSLSYALILTLSLFSFLDDSVPDNVRSKKARREEGFGGTGLSGWESSENRMDVEIDLANPFSSASGSGSKPTSKSKKRSASSPAREEREPSFTMEIQCPMYVEDCYEALASSY